MVGLRFRSQIVWGRGGAEGPAGKKMVGPAAKREAVAHLRTLFAMSERRATTLVGADRTMIRYRARRPDEAALRTRLRDLAHQRHRFGYRRLHVLLRRDGETASRNKVYRLYRAEGLAVRKRKGRRRAVGVRAPLAMAALPNARWSLDFVHDQLACGRRFRVLNVVDDATRECLLAVADTSISGRRVVRELTALVARRGKPGMIVSDNSLPSGLTRWGPSSRQTPCSPGAKAKASPGITSRLASQRRMPSAKASTAACATNF